MIYLCQHTATPTPVPCGWCERERAGRAEARCLALEEQVDRLRTALQTMPFAAYGEAQSEGCDPNGAWDCFLEAAGEHIRAALAEHVRLGDLPDGGDDLRFRIGALEQERRSYQEHYRALGEAIQEIVRLRAALLECAEWLESRPDYTEGDAATASRARAALDK